MASAAAWADDNPPPRDAAGPDSSLTVTLTPQQVASAELAVQPLEPATVTAECRAYGKIVDIHPLLELRAGYRAAQAEASVTEAARELARKNRDRLASLHRESIVATRELIQAEAQFAADSARAQAAAFKALEMREAAIQSFGEPLFKAATDPRSASFDALLARRRMLGMVSLPAECPPPQQGATLRLGPAGQGAPTQTAPLLAPAPRTDEQTQGETWFFTVETGRLRTGMRLDVRLLDPRSSRGGVSIPTSAVVWHGGSPWVYSDQGGGRFRRKPVGDHGEGGQGWLVSEGFRAGEPVVVRGAQMLLSEELRRAIPDEDDD
ncbi:MAG: hypothetical protein FIA97_04790 [Methylococcaceae bacterium]|nr:hypothetical protein [Methylococcaceae bacterium]